MAADDIYIDGRHFFLMESETYGRDAAFAVVDECGRKVADDSEKGFTEEVIREIEAFIDGQDQAIEQNMQPHPKPRLEVWQQYLENGEYLRAAEISEEQNYNMIDGRINNIAKRQQKQQAEIRETGGRESVLRKLHRKQAELSGRDPPQHIPETEYDRQRK